MQREEVIPAGTSRIRHRYIANFARRAPRKYTRLPRYTRSRSCESEKAPELDSRRNQIEMLEVKIRAVGLYLKSRTAIETAMHSNWVKGGNSVTRITNL